MTICAEKKGYQDTIEKIHGIVGWAIFFKIYELISKEPGKTIDLSNPFIREQWLLNLGVREGEFTDVINTMVRIGAIEKGMWEDAKLLNSELLNYRAVWG